MIRDNEIDELKKLIQSGFDLELISFELNIPLEDIQQIKQEIDEKNRTINTRDKEAQTPIQQMRERYKNLYFKSNQESNVVRKELSEKEIEKINLSIIKIENIIKEMKDASKYERRKNVNGILEEMKKIQEYSLTVEQAEQLNVLFNAKELQKLSLNVTDKIASYINRYKKSIVKKLAEAVDVAQYQTEDVKELKVLERKITSEMERKYPISVGAVRSRISNRILKIQQNQALDRMRNDIPDSISGIITDLVNGTVDVEKASEIIKEEAKKKVDSKPKTKFSLTEQQEEKQILMRIGMAIRKKADRFHITNPELTIIKLQELSGGDLEQAIRTIVENLISVKNFEEAKRVCEKFTGKDRESQISKEIRDLRLRIRNAEIGDMVLKGMNIQGTEEEIKYFELIEKGIKIGNVKLRSISLGKSQDGTREITLADIWTDENER